MGAVFFRLYTSSFFSPNISSIFVAREFQFSFIRSDELAVCIQVVEWSSWFSLWVYTGSVQGCGDCPVLYNSYLAESFTRVLAVALGSLVTSLATFLSSLWSLVSYLCEGCSVLCDCLWISWYYFSFQFLTLWNTLKHSNHFVCSSSALWPSTVLLLSLNWLLLFSAWCCLSFKENAMLKIPCSFIKALGKFLTNSNFIEISKLYLA